MRRLSDGMLLMIVGAALGPLDLNVLSQRTLSVIDPAMPVALVALGMLVGLGVEGQRTCGRLAGAAIIETALDSRSCSGCNTSSRPYGAPLSSPSGSLRCAGDLRGASAAASLHASRTRSLPPDVSATWMDCCRSRWAVLPSLLRRQSSPIDAVPVLCRPAPSPSLSCSPRGF